MMKPFLSFFLFLFFPAFVFGQGTVYLVLGSDTGIWEGLNPGAYHCTYNLGLYDDPARNAYAVMNPAFRDQFKDSFGKTMKMTWWMMAGNAYRYATNTNVPVPNTMTLYLMKKYHGENIKRFGDELSLHYHTFTWTDYNQDGTYYWNQAKNFTECREDFDVTLAQFLLEENTVPVSYRSGWHYMDNEWQNYIDDFIPYSMHNDYPAKRTSVAEPIDNVYDWSRASKEYVPYRVSLSDYQLPGTGKSWNVRSKYMASFSAADMDALFNKAMNGIDQVACLWAHLPEADFAQNMKRLDSLAHLSAGKFPAVKFSYSTGIEAMQRWRKGTDTIPPTVTGTVNESGDNITYTVTSNEPIFQSVPMIAMKDIYERYTLIPSTKSGTNQWSTGPLPKAIIAKLGAAVLDTMGNAGTVFHNVLPEDLYLDNLDSSYSELRGAWTTSAVRSWGTNSRTAILAETDTVIAQWSRNVPMTGRYNLFLQVPNVQNHVTTFRVTVFSGGSPIDTINLTGPFKTNTWIYLTTLQLDQSQQTAIRLTAAGAGQSGKLLAADIIKLSGLVKERSIHTAVTTVQPDPISEQDSVVYPLTIENRGIGELSITNVIALNKSIQFSATLPITVPAMGSVSIPLLLYSPGPGEVKDTIVVFSNDPLTPQYKIAVRLTFQPYFRVIDNEDPVHYKEFGPWAKSVAQVYGSSSRYAPSGTGAAAIFTAEVKKTGLYEIFEIVPKTVNAVTKGVYTIQSGADTIGTVPIDQNNGSGAWVSLGKYHLSPASPVSIRVRDSGAESNFVLRADAVKVQLAVPSTVQLTDASEVTNYVLEQNYPNPFNPHTIIRFSLPSANTVSLTIYDMLGRTVQTLLHEERRSGTHTVSFDGRNLASGMYIYRFTAGTFIQSKVMMLLK